MAQINRAGGNSPTVLVIDDSNLCRELVVAALRGNGYTTLSAADGVLGMAQLEHNHVDAVILDNEMPKMTGLEFLKAVRGDARWERLPVVMLTTNISKEVITEAMSRKVSGYLLKAKFSMPEMLARVHTAVAHGRPAVPAPAPATAPKQESKPVKPAIAARPRIVPPDLASLSVPNLVTRDATLAAVAEFTFCKTLSGAVSELTKIADSPRPTVADMAAVIKQDPILAANVVNLAAVSGQKARLANIDDAVRIVGVDAVRNLVTSISVFCEFPPTAADGLPILKCWKHAMAVAAVMARIVPKTDAVPPGLPYAIGLFHDLAEFMLRLRFPGEFAAAADFAEQAQVSVMDAILPVFGISYAEITEALFQQLKFPAIIAEPIRDFTPKAGKPIDAHKSLLARSLAISDAMAHGMLLASSADALVYPVPLNDCRTMLIPATAINCAEVRSESTTAISMLANIGPADEGLFSKPLLNRHEGSIWYMRDASFAHLDPIEAALSNIASVKVHEHLPQSGELAGLQVLAILSSSQSRGALSEARRLRTQSGKEFTILHIVPASEAGGAGDGADFDEVSHPVSLSRLAHLTSPLSAA